MAVLATLLALSVLRELSTVGWVSLFNTTEWVRKFARAQASSSSLSSSPPPSPLPRTDGASYHVESADAYHEKLMMFDDDASVADGDTNADADAAMPEGWRAAFLVVKVCAGESVSD